MVYIIAGTISFIFFFLYDFNSVSWKNPVIKRFFFAGSSLLTISTLGMLYEYRPYIMLGFNTRPLWLLSFLLFTGLLIYTLFFALPFDTTYIRESEKRKVYTAGIYAICRHPGVLWFIGMYYSLYLLIQHSSVLWVATIWSLWNILYVIFQDRWVFPRTFEDYPAYQGSTPFLIPNLMSLYRKKFQSPERSSL